MPRDWGVGVKYPRTYRIWKNMRSRCNNPNVPHFSKYGGRGIKVCTRWNRFKTFLEDMGAAPDTLQIDRIDNNKGYFPKNCRWSTGIEQCNNTRRNRLVNYRGKTKTLTIWCRELRLHYFTVKRRLNQGWSAEDAFTQPLKPGVPLQNRSLSSKL